MIHPTRTNLLLLREKCRSVENSTGILKARRQALIRELLAITAPFLESRDAVQAAYGRAIRELALAVAIAGDATLESIEAVAERDLLIEIEERNVMGLRYREVTFKGSPLRQVDERGYDYRASTAHLEEALHLFETVLESMLEIAAYEARLKRLGEEVVVVTRRIRVLEERVLPGIRRQTGYIAQFLEEREREATYRLKRYMAEKRSAMSTPPPRS